MAGLVLTGITVTFYAIIMDIAAVIMVHSDHEYIGTDINASSFNLYVTYFTLAFDGVAVLFSGTIHLIHCTISCKKHQSLHILYFPLWLILGCDKTKEFFRDSESIKNERRMWLLFCRFYPSLFCISSHLGYILVAWLTEPDRTSSITLVALAILFYLFVVYRAVYDIIIVLFHKSCGQDGFPCCKEPSAGLNNENNRSSLTDREDEENESPPVNRETNAQPATDKAKRNFVISIKALIAAGFIGSLFIIPVGSFLAAFIFLPIPVIELASYLESILQVVLVLLATLLSYRFLSFKDPETVRFMRNFRESCSSEIQNTENGTTTEQRVENFKDKVTEQGSGDEFEETGKVVGKVFHAVLKKCSD